MRLFKIKLYEALAWAIGLAVIAYHSYQDRRPML